MFDSNLEPLNETVQQTASVRFVLTAQDLANLALAKYAEQKAAEGVDLPDLGESPVIVLGSGQSATGTFGTVTHVQITASLPQPLV